MSLTFSETLSAAPIELPHSFADWRAAALVGGSLPVVAVAGSRGKSTTIDLFDAMLTAYGLRTARWTDGGVWIAGRRQRGELAPWTRALGMLASNTLDIAIQELDWDTVHAVGLPRNAYPLVAVTNLCANSEACLLREDTLRAVRALRTVREAAHPDAVFVLSGDDWAVAGGEAEHLPRQVLAAVSPDTPLLRAHRGRRGTAAWIEHGKIRFGSDSIGTELAPVAEVLVNRGGSVGFLTSNVLLAASLSLCAGVPARTVAEVLRNHRPDPEELPGSFNLLECDGATVVIDRPTPPYFLRAPLRAISHLPGHRHIRIVGKSAGIEDADLQETGRLLGRGAGLVVIHGEEAAPERASLLRQGIAALEVPPAVVQASTESAAISAVLRLLRPDDVVYVVADDPRTAIRRLRRSGRRAAPHPD
jgi:UDP-N-acetylmuramyl tripeptide synthase